MKKIIGILGTAALALTMYMNTNSANGISTNLDLESLVALNNANAECIAGDLGICRYTTSGSHDCFVAFYNQDCQ